MTNVVQLDLRRLADRRVQSASVREAAARARDAYASRVGRARRLAKRQGLVLAKWRGRDPAAPDCGKFRLARASGSVVLEWLTLDGVNICLKF
jgi:hypothetical protein